MSEDSDSDLETVLNDPYRDDPVWEDWHAQAVDVQGGAEEETSSEDEVEAEGMSNISLPEHCVCHNCRYVQVCAIQCCGTVSFCLGFGSGSGSGSQFFVHGSGSGSVSGSYP
jgi:hypothetical protein